MTTYLTKNWLTQNRPELNHTQPKVKRPEMSLNPNMTRLQLDLTCTRTERPIYQVYSLLAPQLIPRPLMTNLPF